MNALRRLSLPMVSVAIGTVVVVTCVVVRMSLGVGTCVQGPCTDTRTATVVQQGSISNDVRDSLGFCEDTVSTYAGGSCAQQTGPATCEDSTHWQTSITSYTIGMKSPWQVAGCLLTHVTEAVITHAIEHAVCGPLCAGVFVPGANLATSAPCYWCLTAYGIIVATELRAFMICSTTCNRSGTTRSGSVSACR
jgi:hypothetical protein